ncbi:RNA polymerase sigma factor [Herbiconiux ginsengi]|nr:sigma-70 family RNA polymerase sigma factor [Herbiconiux ginsengi]
MLWRRHSDAAYRYASRLIPAQADDLVSEAFVAILHQVTTTDKGPQFAFRSYLKAVIRNTAAEWERQAGRYLNSDDLDQADLRDGLSLLEQKSDSEDVITAFRSLPDRWQRVLWLAEVTEAGRAEIAKELGIKPNAVSALQRRARTGLRFQWLTQQIPAALRDDTDHVARLIPQYLTEPNNGAVAVAVTTHVRTCSVCEDLLRSTRARAAGLRGGALAIVLASAGVGATTTVTLSSGTAAAAAIAGVSGWFLIGGATVAAVGGLIVTSVVITAPPSSAPADAAAPVSVSPPAPVPESGPAPSAIIPVAPPIPAAPPTPASPVSDEEPTGRLVTDPTVPSVTLIDDPDQEMPSAPPRPTPAPPDTPEPGTEPSTQLSPGVTSPVTYTGYSAPVITGRTSPGDDVAVALDARRYAPVVADDGTWSFDPRALQLDAGTYDYQVWAYNATSQSVAVAGTFTVLPLQLRGFEQLTGFEDMTVEEAQTTGVVIAITGPPDGRVSVTTMQGVSATITLDENGYTRKRLLLNARGWYYFSFRALDSDGFWGPVVESAVDVFDPEVIFDPWGPDPEEMTFDLVDP